MLKRIVGLCVPLAFAACAAGPATAGVAELERYEVGTRDPGGKATIARIIYHASPHEANRLSVTYHHEAGLLDDSKYVTIRDSTGVVAGPGCSSGETEQEVRCDFSDTVSAELRISLGDEADTALVAGETPPSGGPAPAGAVIAAGPGDDRIDAGPIDGALDGGPGDDLLISGEPTAPRCCDVVELRGGTGNDRMLGGSKEDRFIAEGTRDGRDTMIGGGGGDIVSYAARTRGVRADLEGDRDDGARGERDRIARDIESLEGGSGSDRLFGDRGDNGLFAGDGRDLLVGRRGDDMLDGATSQTEGVSATGGDRIVAGRGDDHIAGGAGADVIDAGAGQDFVGGNAGSDQIDLQDGTVDEVLCGDGRDRIMLDQRDYFSNRYGGVCEMPERSRPPVGVFFGRGVAGHGQEPAVTAVVGCPGDASRACTGEAEMVVDGRSGGAAPLSIEPDEFEQLRVELDPDAWERHRRGENVTGELVLRVRTPQGAVARLAYSVKIT